MALAPDKPTWLHQPPFQDSGLSFDLLRLSGLIGVGLIRVDGSGRAWPLNEAGVTLLESLGGAYGIQAPPILSELLSAAAMAGLAQTRETVTQPPESRHVTVAVLGRASTGLVALRDQTDERMLQERLLQSEKMASVGQLVSGVAHELNNPLTGVMGFAQLLLSRELDDTARTQVETIYGEAERAAKIVQNLLSFARRRKPTKEMADVNSLLQRVLELRSYDFAVRNIQLDMTLDTRMSKVWVDPDQIQQVLFNVIKNAEQAMIDSHGGGKLTVITRGTPEGIRVTIGDDGPGIAPDVARRIFDPFFTTKDAGEGTGLGLTICYSIIDEHGGRIWTENRPASEDRPLGGGALFHIDLPVGAGEEKEAPASNGNGAVAVTAPELMARRVLVVDDEVSIRLLLHDILRLDQHSVALASSGLEAADLVSREKFDIIITDMKMPGMDGATFYRQVRQRDPAQARRIIFITGDTVSPDTRAFLQRVSNPVLSKPFKIGPLRDAIETVLQTQAG
jgi:two-component system NtrC family sensor kinase